MYVWNYVKPTLRDDKPDHIILHTGTNDLRSEKTASQIARSITELTMLLKDNDNSVIVSGIVPRNGNLNNKATEVNNCFSLMCKEQKIPFIAHSEILIRVNISMRVSYNYMITVQKFLPKIFQYF